MISFKDLVGEGDCPTGTWIKLPSVESVELMALSGFDFVVIDLEHSPISMETASSLIAMATALGLCPLVRVPDQSQWWIQRSLDAGASGIMAPHVDTIQQAQAIDRAAHFEPRGARGVGPTSRAGNWGLTPMGDYLAEGDQVAVIDQIESDQGIRAVPEMVGTGIVDALLIGPADLSVSLGKAMDDPEVEARMLSVLDICRSAGVPCGTAIGADAQQAAKRAEQGYAFVVVSNDATILGSSAARLVKEIGAARPRTPAGGR